MGFHLVLEELKKRDYLSPKEFLILQELLHQDLTAQQISKKTDIPLGRIYDPLNYLIEQRLIEKKGKKPCKYSFDQSSERVLAFLKSKFDHFINDEEVIFSMIDEKTAPKIELIPSKEEFTFYLCKILSACKTDFLTIARYGSLPFNFYPSNKKDFLKLRDLIEKKRTTIAHTTEIKSTMVYQAYQDALKKGNSFQAICNKDTFLWHLDLIRKNLGKDFLKMVIEDFKKKCREHDVRMYIIDEYLPMQVFINQNTVVLFHIYSGIGSGLEIQNKETVSLYRGMFEEMKKRCKPVELYLRKV
ncbi:MAG: hypothetical protein WCV90_01650 [Candidatus Woesearchaeota archaeon]